MKKKSLLQELVTLGLTLMVISVVIGGLVAFIYETTKEQIAMNNAVNADDLAVIMPGTETIEDFAGEFEANEVITEMYRAKSGDEVIGHVYKMTVNGYKPGLTILAGIDKDGNLVAAKVTQSSETPGFGALVAEEAFISQFTGKTTAADFQVVKGTAASENEIVAVSGATISSNAVASAINEAVKFHKQNILGEEVVEEKAPEATIETLLLTGDEMVEIEGEYQTFEVKTAGEVTGYIVITSHAGYYQDMPMTIAVGFDNATKKISNIVVLEQNETKGLGDVIEQEGFQQLFQGKDAQELTVEIYSGASESSKGAFKAVNQAILYYNDVLMQGGN